MVPFDFYRIAIPLLTPDGVDESLLCWSLYFARGNRKSAPLGLEDRARRTSSSPKGGAHFGGESYPHFEGTRHKAQGDFFKKLLTTVGTSQLPVLNKKIQLYIYLPFYTSHTPRVWRAHTKNC